MSTFGFRLRFNTPAGRTFKGAQRQLRIRLPLGEGKVHLSKIKRPRKNRFGLPESYAFLGRGFPTEESAFECGTRLKKAISILMAKRRLGINVGKDKATSATNTAMKDMMKEKHGVQLRDDIHGLDVYSDDPPVTRFSLSGTVTVSYEIKDFQISLANLFASE
ncbi:MAG: hypothetical protein ACRD9R_08495, partial [Pyrinomonadaceae bacterium]